VAQLSFFTVISLKNVPEWIIGSGPMMTGGDVLRQFSVSMLAIGGA